MSQVTVHKLNSTSPEAQFVVQQMEHARRTVEQRAFVRFQERNGSQGDPLEDWLSAERELFLVPDVEVNHLQDDFEIYLAVEELPLERLTISVLPDSIIVQAEPDLSRRPLLRQIYLPEEIDPQSVRAAIDDSVLRIVAGKRASRVPSSRPSNSQREPKETSVAA